MNSVWFWLFVLALSILVWIGVLYLLSKSAPIEPPSPSNWQLGSLPLTVPLLSDPDPLIEFCPLCGKALQHTEWANVEYSTATGKPIRLVRLNWCAEKVGSDETRKLGMNVSFGWRPYFDQHGLDKESVSNSHYWGEEFIDYDPSSARF